MRAVLEFSEVMSALACQALVALAQQELEPRPRALVEAEASRAKAGADPTGSAPAAAQERAAVQAAPESVWSAEADAKVLHFRPPPVEAGSAGVSRAAVLGPPPDPIHRHPYAQQRALPQLEQPSSSRVGREQEPRK